MNKSHFIIILMIATTCLFSQAPKGKIEKEASFPGGLQAMVTYIQKNLHYPDSARSAGIGGKCYMKFIVNEDGAISNVEVLKGVPGCPACDREAIRVAAAMPSWEPARMDGRNVKCYFNLPISFKVQDVPRSNTDR